MTLVNYSCDSQPSLHAANLKKKKTSKQTNKQKTNQKKQKRSTSLSYSETRRELEEKTPR